MFANAILLNMAQTDPEIAFCELICLEKNKKGDYVYKSEKGSSIIDIPHILKSYEKYLNDKKQKNNNYVSEHFKIKKRKNI